MEKLIIREIVLKLMDKYECNAKLTTLQGNSNYILEIPSSNGYLCTVTLRCTKTTLQYNVTTEGVTYTGSHKLNGDESTNKLIIESAYIMLTTMLLDIDNYIKLRKIKNNNKIIKDLYKHMVEQPYEVLVLTKQYTTLIQIKRSKQTPEQLTLTQEGNKVGYTSINRNYQNTGNHIDTLEKSTILDILERIGWT